MTKSFTAVTLLSITIGLSISPDTHAVGYGGLFGSVLGQSGGENMNVDEALSRMSEKMNRRMPQAVDAETRLDSVNGWRRGNCYPPIGGGRNSRRLSGRYPTGWPGCRVQRRLSPLDHNKAMACTHANGQSTRWWGRSHGRR